MKDKTLMELRELKNQGNAEAQAEWERRHQEMEEQKKNDDENWEVCGKQQSKIDQLKAKNTALIHALVSANAEKKEWAGDYWKQVERTAEYGAMLFSSDSDLKVLCFKKEKEIEKLKAEKREILEVIKKHDRYIPYSTSKALKKALRGDHE